MPGRGWLPLLIGAALLISGCTQAPQGGTPAPDFVVRNLPPSPAAGGGAAGSLVPGGVAGGAATAGGTGSASPPSPASGSATAGASGTSSGPAAGLGSAIVGCTAGTPWEYSSGSVTTPAGYKVTYTINGKTFFKGAEYCKVSGKVEVTGVGVPSNYLPVFDYYFRADPTGASYADIWYAYTIAGQTQEIHVLAGGAGGATVSGSATAGAASVPTPSIPTPIAGVPLATASGKPPGECEKYLTPAEGKAVWPANTWDFKSTETARTKSGLLAHRDDPNGISGPSGEKYITASGLWCAYGGGGGTQFTYVIVTFPSAGSASTTGRKWGADPGDGTGLQGLDPTCQIYSAPVQESSDFGGPTCASSVLRERFFIKGAKSVHVSCGDCTQAQLDSLAKTIAGRL